MEHISWTQVMMFLRCQQQWRRRYVEGLILPPAGAMVVGSAAHRGIEHSQRSLATTGRPAPWDEVADRYSQAFDTESKDALWEGEDPGEAKDRGYGALRKFHSEAGDAYPPAVATAVEERIEFAVGGTRFLGFADTRTKDHVVDFKVASRRTSEASDAVTGQVSLYLHGYRLHGLNLQGGQVVHLVATKKPALEVVTVAPSPAQTARLLSLVDDVRAAMEQALKTGIFLPALPGQWYCSEKTCGYWSMCRGD